MKTVVFAAIAALVAFAPVHAAESKSASSSSSSASHLAADAVACDPAALAAACPGKDKACMDQFSQNNGNCTLPAPSM